MDNALTDYLMYTAYLKESGTTETLPADGSLNDGAWHHFAVHVVASQCAHGACRLHLDNDSTRINPSFQRWSSGE